MSPFLSIAPISWLSLPVRVRIHYFSTHLGDSSTARCTPFNHVELMLELSHTNFQLFNFGVGHALRRPRSDPGLGRMVPGPTSIRLYSQPVACASHRIYAHSRRRRGIKVILRFSPGDRNPQGYDIVTLNRYISPGKWSDKTIRKSRWQGVLHALSRLASCRHYSRLENYCCQGARYSSQDSSWWRQMLPVATVYTISCESE